MMLVGHSCRGCATACQTPRFARAKHMTSMSCAATTASASECALGPLPALSVLTYVPDVGMASAAVIGSPMIDQILKRAAQKLESADREAFAKRATQRRRGDVGWSAGLGHANDLLRAHR